MEFNKLIKKCAEFEVLATQTATPAAKVDFELVKRLRETLLRYKTMLPSAFVAKNVFNAIAEARAKNQQDYCEQLKELQRILIQIEFCEEKVPNAEIMAGLHAGDLAVIKKNIQTLMDAKDFNGYRHYTILYNGEAPMIDIDEWSAKNVKNPNDLGF
jgi:hypothetical protein